MTYENGEMHDEEMPKKGAKGKRVEFSVPSGFVPPEGEGDKFELVTTFAKKPDGKTLCIVKMGEFEMPGYKGGEEHDETIEEMEMKGKHAPDYKSYSEGLMNSLGESSQSPNSY